MNENDVRNVARLARLGVSEDELSGYARQLADILAMVAELQAVDTSGVVPMAHPLELAQPLRADEPTETDQRELYQRNAPVTERGLYLVPRVIE